MTSDWLHVEMRQVDATTCLRRITTRDGYSRVSLHTASGACLDVITTPREAETLVGALQAAWGSGWRPDGSRADEASPPTATDLDADDVPDLDRWDVL